MDLEHKFELITRGVEEVITVRELRERLERGERLRAYIGFEPSGLVHIGWLIWIDKVRDFLEAGIDMIVLEATWHAYINDKLGGDLDLIRASARLVRKVMEGYGIDISRIKFLDAEDLASRKDYWEIFIRSSKNVTLARVKRALTIMGRKAGEAEADFSKLVYPIMQVTDMFYLDIDIALGGTDQRRAHVLQRDIAEKLGWKKVIAIHTPLLVGLMGPGKRMDTVDQEEILIDAKMSKSKPETAIFVHDSPEDIRRKIRRAYCPPREVELNPVIQINKLLLFRREGFKLYIDRPAKYGGPLEINSYGELEKLYKEGKIHPLDLKNATAEALIGLLEPIRKKLSEDREASELLQKLLRAKITR